MSEECRRREWMVNSQAIQSIYHIGSFYSIWSLLELFKYESDRITICILQSVGAWYVLMN